MSLLNGLLQSVAYSLIVVPTAILIIGIFLFYYKPAHRLTAGIILVALGSIGLSIFSFSLYFSLAMGRDTVIFVFTTLLAIEILTIITGIVSLIKNKSNRTRYEGNLVNYKP